MSDTPPPEIPSRSFMKRCKFIWRLLLLSNLALGAVLFARAKQRDSRENREKKSHKFQRRKAAEVPPPEPPITTSSMDINYEDYLVPDTTPVKVHAPIPEEQQRQIFEWMLEEKRKVKPKDAVEKKQIDEEKAILKQVLRAKSIPKF